MQLTKSFRFGLAMGMPIRKSTSRKSGFVGDEGTKQPLFNRARLAGYAAALKTGFVETLTVYGGEEAAYLPHERIVRPQVIAKMLVEDFGVEEERVQWEYAPPYTKGVIAEMAKAARRSPRECVYLSSAFHIDRSMGEFYNAGVLIAARGVEALLLVEGSWSTLELVDYFGGGSYAETVVKELRGIADDLLGRYQTIVEKPLG